MARGQGQASTMQRAPRTRKAAGINATPAAKNGARSAPTVASVASDIVEAVMREADTYLGPAWRQLGEQGQAAWQARVTTNVRERLRRAVPKIAAMTGAAG